MTIERQFARIRGRRHLQWFAGMILWFDGAHLRAWR